MTKIFVTGATGYIGGDALYAIATAHPEYEITALVRNSDKGAKVASQYAKIKLVYGDLDSSELIEQESKVADIVCHFANADHEGSARAIIKGLSNHDPSVPGFYIHTSGTGILMWEDIRESKTNGYGLKFRDKVYDDLENVSEVTALPDEAPHRNVDKIVLGAGTNLHDRVKTAIVSPPTIYGPGRGPDNKRSHQVPELIRTTLEKGYTPRMNDGKTYWGNVHVHDLSALYLKLVEEAAAGGSTREWPDKPPTWGAEGYYFCENGEHVWADVSQWVADEAKKQKLIESNQVKPITAEDAASRTPAGHVLWGANSRGRAKRGKELLSWKPEGGSLKEEISRAVEEEAKRLSNEPGHAAVAAGDV
ncbi:Putative NAD-dependent epimerase/dehydratase, NAD(P)-binding domain-containing protein [Septoria linicola]|uniref:NAD-dependent epimerase/dehydratase, NAD(P)-binding domain-containing protein n=1 Tax=Septoria linicola TaxID=215465 RepID=A0A9Q9EI89_9PEZI|nr:putative NAD-dependent epimerase/dehydratase, NAD(P)-binding domain-containing protein [Septoria linicola]USW52561.1 Putative NAD-dependent epimerase/dehydratase, NAD(P)-binding domain-containing protein [Septoria linicola]